MDPYLSLMMDFIRSSTFPAMLETSTTLETTLETLPAMLETSSIHQH
jgi:hypothetical protein